MRLPAIQGLIRRRLLINFRVDPEVASPLVPPPFRLKLHRGYAIASICLIRLEQVRPKWLPAACGLSSENAAHRIAVAWDEPCGNEGDGVFIPRRDTNSWLNHLTGGRIFPGEQNRADFTVTDDGGRIAMTIRSRDGQMEINLRVYEDDSLPVSSCFESFADSSSFFQNGSVGYSTTKDCCRFDGMRLESHGWGVRPLAIERLESSYFNDPVRFPPGSIAFDHALIMRNLQHAWHSVGDVHLEPLSQQAAAASC